MTTYLLYAKSGKEFEVSEALQDIGIDAWCGRLIEWRRAGKRRRPDAHEVPALPNYIFAEMSPYQFYAAQAVKHLAPTMQIVPASCEKGYRDFQKSTERAYSEQDDLRRRTTTPAPEFAPSASLRVTSGPFRDLLIRFRRVVNPDDPLNRKIEADSDMGIMRLDPLQVKAAE